MDIALTSRFLVKLFIQKTVQQSRNTNNYHMKPEPEINPANKNQAASLKSQIVISSEQLMKSYVTFLFLSLLKCSGDQWQQDASTLSYI